MLQNSLDNQRFEEQGKLSESRNDYEKEISKENMYSGGGKYTQGTQDRQKENWCTVDSPTISKTAECGLSR